VEGKGGNGKWEWRVREVKGKGGMEGKGRERKG